MTITGKKSSATGLEIAVIGMSGRFPGARNLEEYWDNLKNGTESIVFLDEDQLKEAGVSEGMINNPGYIPTQGGVLEDKEYFDAAFFDYTHPEAEVMDPQMRLLHECCWTALEDAGYEPFSYTGLIGLYVGASANFNWQALAALSGKMAELGDFAAAQLIDRDFMATNISYKLNLRGPSVVMQSACSTSLTTIHVACRALITGDSTIALAGGVSVSPDPDLGYVFQEGMIASPDGHCRAFDKDSRGTTRGYGVGIVALKRLKRAVSDGDTIHAIIKGSASNNDGQGKVGYTAPSVKGQVMVIKTAHQVSRVQPESMGYIEAHGTGTVLGDPIEVQALKRAFNTEKANYCGIGSVKSNFGHLDAAAGVAGFIKTVLAVKNRQLPPTLHVKEPNPKLQLENSPFYVVNRLKEWGNGTQPLRAGISSFGIGGTNVHIILEEAPARISETRGATLCSPSKDEFCILPNNLCPNQLILLSARTSTALEKVAHNLGEFLKRHPHLELKDIAFTLQRGRRPMRHRRSFVSDDMKETIQLLMGTATRKAITTKAPEDEPSLVFMFPGQGAQYPDMGLEIYNTYPCFQEAVDKCLSLLESHRAQELKEILYPSPSTRGNDEPSGINQTEFTQPILFIFEYAMAELLVSWGLKPQALIGHSIGEYVAAHLSGVFTLEEALNLVCLRGKLMQSTPHGTMITVANPGTEINSMMEPGVSLAAVNSPLHRVFSGSHQSIETFSKKLEDKGYQVRKLHTSHAYHSQLIEPILDEFEEAVRQVCLQKPRIPFVSNVTGTWINHDQAMSPKYWREHLRQAVQFSKGIETLMQEGDTVFIEVGPGKTLATFTKIHFSSDQQHQVVNMVPHPREHQESDKHLLGKLGQLWGYGQPMDWEKLELGEKGHRIPLPTYPFESQRYWIKGNPFQMTADMMAERSLRKKTDMADWFYHPCWEQSLLIDNYQPIKLGDKVWLVFLDEFELGMELVYQLDSREHLVNTVRPGSTFKQLAEGDYQINPESEEDYVRLFRELKKKKQVPNGILHLWSVTKRKPDSIGLQDLDELQDLGLYSLLNLVKAIGKEVLTHEIQLEVISNGLYQVMGDEEVIPAKATLLGPVKILPFEYPNIFSRIMDVVITGLGAPRRKTLEQILVKEILNPTGEKQVAFRGIHRWIPVMKPLRLEKQGKRTPPLKQKGVYLITGGFGGMGITLAEYLARDYQARLILVGRSPLPSKDRWSEYIKENEKEDNARQKIEKIMEFESFGAEVMPVMADISDQETMDKVITEAIEGFGHIDGLFHTAGLADYEGIIQNRTREMTEKVLAPKVRGTLVLEKLLEDKGLDFWVLFSSLGNHVYGVKSGQVGYNAANEFLDAFSSYRSVKKGAFTKTINWNDWLEVGMTVEAVRKNHPGNPEEIDFKSILQGAILPSEGIEVLNRILENPLHQVAVSTFPLNRLMKKLNNPDNQASENDKEQAEEQNHFFQRPELTTVYKEPRIEEEKKMVEVWENFFRVKPIGIYDNFYELGGDSLNAMQIVHRLKAKGLEVPLDKLFLYQTIEKISNNMFHTGDFVSVSLEEYEAVENYIRETWQIKSRYCGYQLEDDFFRALFVQKGDTDLTELMEAVRDKFGDVLYPNYVRQVESQDEIPEGGALENSTFNEIMGFKDTLTPQEEKEILLCLETPMTKPLKDCQVLMEYPISAIQRSLLVRKQIIARKVMMFSHDFLRPLQEEEIRKILQSLVKKHSLMRSVISGDDTRFTIREYEPFATIEIPFIDISGYSIGVRNEIQYRILQRLFQPFELRDHLLYRVLVLKFDDCFYKLCIGFNHLIFDGKSYGVLEEEIGRVSGEKEEPFKEEITKSYHTYVQFLQEKSGQYQELEKYLDIQQFIEGCSLSNQTIGAGQLNYHGFEMDLSIIRDSLRDHYNEIILISYVRLIKELFKLETVPVLFISSGRNYQDGNFNNIIGDFHDELPMLFQKEREETGTEMFEFIIEYRKHIRNNNINFINYLVKLYVAGEDLSRALTSPFLFNSLLGYQDRKADLSIEKVLETGSYKQIGYQPVKFEISISKKPDSLELFVIFTHSTPFEEEELKNRFTRIFTELVRDFNTNNQ